MIVSLPEARLRYEVENTLRIFLPDTKLDFTGGGVAIDGDYLMISSQRGINQVSLSFGGRGYVRSEISAEDIAAVERSVCRCLFLILKQATGIAPPWGMLTGVRPVHLLRERMRSGLDDAALEHSFLCEDMLSAQKYDLCRAVELRQRDILAANRRTDCSLYVAIPFCPNRCAYCTFVSHSVRDAAKLIPQYVDKLCAELAQAGRLSRERGIPLRTVYIGGGTPTILSAEQLRRVLGAIRDGFDMSACSEFTVEAGRADTIDAEKLGVLADFGVTRISINPQTLDAAVLAATGRGHTVEQFYEAYELATAYPFAVNVDLIAGLAGDAPDTFRRTVDGVIALAPADITVHTLTKKRGSALTESGEAIASAQEAGVMLDYSQQALQSAGYLPYYMYRQKGTVGALENVGYSRPGAECLYNVYIMEECHTIISAGAGAVAKLIPSDGRFERIFNYKYPYEYISRFDEILKRKEDFFLGYDRTTN